MLHLRSEFMQCVLHSLHFRVCLNALFFINNPQVPFLVLDFVGLALGQFLFLLGLIAPKHPLVPFVCVLKTLAFPGFGKVRFLITAFLSKRVRELVFSCVWLFGVAVELCGVLLAAVNIVVCFLLRLVSGVVMALEIADAGAKRIIVGLAVPGFVGGLSLIRGEGVSVLQGLLRFHMSLGFGLSWLLLFGFVYLWLLCAPHILVEV